MRRKVILSVLILFFASLPARAENMLLSFLTSLKKVRTLKVSFVQVTRLDPAFDQKDFYKGIILYKRPSKFKWKYTENSRMEIVSDGKSVFTCIPSERKVLKSPLKDGIDYLPIIRIIESPEKFGKYFRIISDAKFRDKIAFEISPLEKNVTYKKVIVVFKENNPIPISFQVFNDDGSDITYIIENWKENVKLPDTIFTLDRMCNFKEEK
ncbi:LolA family protein [Desulfurobacterium sp.]